MNISWNDLNNVQETGEYPFRDGTISVTFAEVAIWKTDPSAKFQLMRKHPIQSEFKYVLGKQMEGKPAPADNKLIYESSNGDSWSLTRNSVTGALAVMHRPNPQSGGQASFIEIEKFLSEGSNGPEHQALTRLMETSPSVATILIAYDVHPAKGEAYDNLTKAIQLLGTWWHHLETVWIVQCTDTPGEIREKLKPHLESDDQLLIIDISGDAAGWVGINDAGSKWLTSNI